MRPWRSLCLFHQGALSCLLILLWLIRFGYWLGGCEAQRDRGVGLVWLGKLNEKTHDAKAHEADYLVLQVGSVVTKPEFWCQLTEVFSLHFTLTQFTGEKEFRKLVSAF